ncbi:MAG: hypothetical protein J7623_10005 [Chitinophaga sp.]|uniref:hypothetical protein n=1 Tax=Chitinophaga sp. TaxID=1869181 RepID=UPI001B1D68B2|nr:hypothetical protein [Chitinophaga sp.]MBO9728957.1 hypothetical protein [Chitinophaga sp.]
MKLTLILAIVCCCLLNISCKKNSDNSLQTTARAVKRPFGTPKGAAIVKKIGPEGGSISTADGKIRMIIPPGAVTTSVDFSIQPVTNTLPGTKQPCYRLLPENVSFTKPVTLVFTYNDSDLVGTNINQLSLAYQDREGYFHVVMNTEYNKVQHTLTAQTTHFSDWTFLERIKIITDKDIIKPGEKAQLKIMTYENLDEFLGREATIGDLVEYYITANIPRIEWELAVGTGAIQPSGINCTYTAPPAIPSLNPIFISAILPIWNANTKDYSSLAMFTLPITISEDEFVTYTLDGVIHQNKIGSCIGECMVLEADNFLLRAEMDNSDGILIRLLGDSFGTKSYPYGEEDDKAYIMFQGPEEWDWATNMQPCFKCDEHYSSGSVTITKYEPVGGYVEGRFTAELWYQNGSYNPPKKEISGQFRLKRRI